MNKLALAAGAWLGGILLGTLAGVDPAVAALLLLAALLAAAALLLGRWPMLPAVLVALLLLGACRGDAVRLEPLPEALFGRQVFIEGEIASHPETTARRMRFELEISRMSRDTPPEAVRQLTEADAGIYAQSGGPTVTVLVHPDGAGDGDGFDAETQRRRDSGEDGGSVNIIPIPTAEVGGDAAMVTGGRLLLYSDLPPPESDSDDKPSYSYSYGDHLLIHGLLLRPEPIGDFDYPAYLASRGIGGVAISLGGLRLEQRRLFPWRSWLHRLRNGLSESLEAGMPFPPSALGQAMLLGQRQTLPPELTAQFRSAGAAHLLAISGLHIGILLALTAGAAGGLLGRRRGWYLLLPLAAVWGYALLAGATPSVLRAALMGSVYLAALAAGRPGSGLPALALAAAAMTALSPEILLRAGFQLSFAAVAGIFIAQSVFGRWTASRGGGGGGRRLALRPVAALALISAAATLATWPLVAWHFGTVALWGVPASLLAIPAMPAVVVGTGAAAFGELLHPALGEFLGWLAAAPAAYVIAAVSVFPDYTIDLGRTGLAGGGWGPALVIGWYGALAALLLAGPPVRWRRWVAAARTWAAGWRAELAGARPFRLLPVLTLAAGTAIAAGILWTMALGGCGSGDGRLRVHFFDVGQGDAALIVTPGGRQLLIDGGPEAEGAARALARTLPGGDRSLDLVALTHLDADHSRGLLETLDRYRVGAVLEGLRPPEAAMLPQWAARLERHNLRSIPLRAGHAVELEPGLTLETLNPPMLPSANAGANTNDTGAAANANNNGNTANPNNANDSGNNPNSGGGGNDNAYAAGGLGANNGGVVLRLEYGAVSILLAADIEAETEERLLREGVLQPSTLLKVPHHGSNTSTTAAFLEAVSPQAAIVSVGAGNPYGHPSPAVMERLAAHLDASRIFRTDQHGDITLTTDGQTLQIATQK